MLSNYDPDGLASQIDEIIDDLDGAAQGVARLISGQDSLEGLSAKQRAVYDIHIHPALVGLAERKEAAERKRRWDAAGD